MAHCASSAREIPMAIADPPPPAKDGAELLGKVNYFALLIGPPEHGKSSLSAELALDRLKRGRWILAQDQNHEFGRFCVRYDAAADFKRALARASDQGKPFAQGAAFPCAGEQGADEVLELAVELGEQWNRAAGGTREPICVVINEASGFEGAGSTFLGRLQNVCLNQRRHLGIELVYCLTRPSMLPRPVYDVATDAFLFYQPSLERIRTLESLLGLDRGELDRLGALPPHAYVHWTPRRGDGRGGLV
jgi:hypothetical protein